MRIIMKLKRWGSLYWSHWKEYIICTQKLRKYTKDDCVIYNASKEILYAIHNRKNTEKIGITILQKFQRNWNPYNKQKKEIYRRRYLRKWKLNLTSVPPRKSSILELLKLIILHLPAIKTIYDVQNIWYIFT